MVPGSRIKNYAFQFNKLTEVTLPKSLKKLGYGVFMSNNLTKINFNNELEEIDQICFYGNDLKQIVIPASVKKIMRAAFRKINLTDITFADGSNLELIDTLALADNPLKTIKLPEGLGEFACQ